jgi:purine-binding chemotaxis protein CheW
MTQAQVCQQTSDSRRDVNLTDEPWVIFVVGGERFGAPALGVQTMVSMPKVCAVPQTPDYVRGVINLRGQTLALIDLRRRLGLPAAQRSDDEEELQEIAVVLETNDRAFAVAVDSVESVEQLLGGSIEDTPSIITVDEHLVASIGRRARDDSFVQLLDVPAIINGVDRIEEAAA